MSKINWATYQFDEEDLTAFALGAAEHLEDDTRAAIDAAIAVNKDLRDEIAAIQTAATTIEAALSAVVDTAPALASSARESVMAAAAAASAAGRDGLAAEAGETDSELRPMEPSAQPSAERAGFGWLVRPLAWLIDGSAPQVAGKLAMAGVAMWLIGLPMLRWSAYPYIVDDCPMCEEVTRPERPRLLDFVLGRDQTFSGGIAGVSGDLADAGSAAMGSEVQVLPASAPAAEEFQGAMPEEVLELMEDDAESGDSGMYDAARPGEIPEDIPLTGQPMALTLRSTPPPPPPVPGGAAYDPSAADQYDTARGFESRPAPESPPQPIAPGLPPNFNSEAYAEVEDNPFRRAADHPLSTFSIDVDTASYSNIRRYIQQMGQLPPPSAVRIEEMINYFDYDYAPPGPNSETPFAVHVEIADAPWATEHRLVRVGIKGREIERDSRPDSNLVFLIDVSGSMSDPNKLPLVQRSLGMLVEELGARDRVGIVTYAGTSGVALRSTSGDDKRSIMRVVDALGAGGSTAGAAGIQDAYDLASGGFIEGGVNRVILLTDGDFNVGVTSHDELQRIIEDQAKRGIFLSVLGFGMGNYKDDTLELLADKGNGNYGYIDTEAEARKLFVEQMSGTLVTIAKDVKIQVEFNPAEVEGYRLIGYENRILAARDFNDDTKDAGEIGAGHTVTALYEVVPAGVQYDSPGIDPLRYDDDGPADDQFGDIDPLSADGPGELLFVKLRHKAPDSETSTRVDFPVFDEGQGLRNASDDFRFAAGVAAFGMLLRNSPHVGDATFEDAFDLARSGEGDDENGYRAELIELIRMAGGLVGRY